MMGYSARAHDVACVNKRTTARIYSTCFKGHKVEFTLLISVDLQLEYKVLYWSVIKFVCIFY
jgi:hypothetical protein